MYINSHVVSGNVGQDAVLRDAGDTKVLSFSLANTSPFGQKITTWYNVSFFGKQAEKIAHLITKGQALVVVGETINRPYDDKEGNKRYSLDLRASTIQLAGGGQAAASTEEANEDDGDGLF